MLRGAAACPVHYPSLLGFTFGSFAAVGSGLLSIVALLACPIGMYLMMRMMMTGKK
jgi:hypothetical protein